MPLKTDSATALERLKSFSTGKPLHKRKLAGLDDDYIIIDENGQEVWASELARRYWRETYPRPILRHRVL
jgi:hypothetical protein